MLRFNHFTNNELDEKKEKLRSLITYCATSVASNLNDESKSCSFFAFGKKTKAKLIRSALSRVNFFGMRANTLDEVLDFKYNGQMSLREALNKNRLLPTKRTTSFQHFKNTFDTFINNPNVFIDVKYDMVNDRYHCSLNCGAKLRPSFGHRSG